MKGYIWKSKFTRRLVVTFVSLVALPLIVTVIILGQIGREQIVRTTRVMEQINRSTVAGASSEFQRLGRAASHKSGTQTVAVSANAIRSVSGKLESIQTDSLAVTQREFSAAIQKSFESAMEKFLETNRVALGDVSKNMENLLLQSAKQTQKQASSRVEQAMRNLIGQMIQERARRLALTIGDHVSGHMNYLTLTAQLPTLRDGNVPGEKAVLDALVRRYPMLMQVSVMDTHGKETAMSASDQIVTPSDLGRYPDAPYFKAAMRGEAYTAKEPSPSLYTAPVLRLAVPIEIYHGKVAGVLTARLSLLDLWDTVRNTRIGRNGFAYVLDKNHQPLLPARMATGPLLTQSAEVDGLQWHVIVAEPSGEAMQPITSLENDITRNTHDALAQMRAEVHKSEATTSARLQRETQAIHNNTTRQVREGSEQSVRRLKLSAGRQTQEELAHVRRATEAQARLTEEQTGAQMSAAAAAASEKLARDIPQLTAHALRAANKRLSIMALVIMAVSCAIGSLLALILAGRIVRPVVLLAQGTRAIAAGDLNKRVDEHAPDEIGDLAIAFNKMAASLAKSNIELRGAEAQLVQSAKLASLGTLSAGVAHELNQPVAIIRGISQQLRGQPGLPVDAEADIALIEGQTGRMMQIIKHLRTFCRASGIEMTEVDVNESIRNCFILIGAQLKAHNVRVELDLCGDAPCVLGDSNELEQVFLNLITNARDAMEGRQDARITIRSRMENGRLILEFRDNGPGIPVVAARHIFDPFFTTKEAGKGTGLGLSISHGIIEKHNGTIEAGNDGGAVFTIVLPAVEEASEERAPLRLAA